METVVIPARFNGPPNSGNGGYSCGVVAAHIDGVARVRLHSPPPLDTGLRVERDAAGAVSVYSGDNLVASGRSEALDMAIPASPGLEAARRGRDNFPFLEGHSLPTCFVCGSGRPERDGLELFTGPVDDSGLVACTWSPANITPKVEITASNVPSSNGNRSASASRKSMDGSTCAESMRAAASRRSAMSTPVTRAPAAATLRAVQPVPVATSRTVSPGRGASRCAAWASASDMRKLTES